MRKFTIGEDWTPKKLGRFCEKVYLYVFRNVKFDVVGFVIRYIYKNVELDFASFVICTFCVIPKQSRKVEYQRESSAGNRI